MPEAIVDTSAWVAYFRPGSSKVTDRVEQLLEQDAAVLVGPVLSELLQGVRGRRETTQLQRTLSVLTYHETKRQDWQAAGELMATLRQRGITVPLTDVLIATLAKRLDLSVLTLDKHFDHLEVRRLVVD